MIVQLFDPTWYLTAPSGFSLFGNVLFGSNGLVPWQAELAAGTSQATADASKQWDEDLEDGFDTDEISVDFDADLADGTVDMLVDDQPLSFDGSLSGSATVGAVWIRAGASVRGAVQWGELTVSFWSGSTLVESVDVAGPQASTAASTTGVAEQNLLVTPSAGTVDRVTVCGAFRMFAYDAPFEASSLFGQILIMPAVG